MILDTIENADQYKLLGNRMATALDYMKTADLSTIDPGKYEIEGSDIFALVQDYDTKNRLECKLESHRKYIDIQYLLKGIEFVGHTLLNNQKPVKEYSAEDDYMLFSEESSFFELKPGMFAIFHPSDLHMPSVYEKNPEKVRKVVIKVKI